MKTCLADWAPAFAGVMRRQLDTGVRRCDEILDSSFRRKPESRMRRCDEAWALA